MWNLLLEEFNYNKLQAVLLYSLVMVISFILINYTDGEANIFVALCWFFIIHRAFVLMMKEKRDRLFLLLPLPSWKIGLTRVLIMLIPFFLVIAQYFVIKAIFSEIVIVIDDRYLFTMFGIYQFAYTVFFIFRDALKSVLTLDKSKIVIIGMFVTLMGTAHFLFLLKRFRGGPMDETPLIVKLLGGVFSFLFSIKGIVILFGICGVVYLISVLTFVNKKSYL